MSQITILKSGGGGGGGITTIDGDTGSVTGSTVSFNALGIAGSTVSFSGSGTTMNLNFSDSNNNTILGLDAGLEGSGATGNTVVGFGAYSPGITPGGTSNTIIGTGAGGDYDGGSESYNILIGAEVTGVSGENNTLHIGDAAGGSALTSAYIGGIYNVTPGGASPLMMVITNDNQLGTQAIPSAGIVTIDGDSGSATGSTVTLSGGSTGLTTSASSATVDLTGTLNVGHGGTGDTSFTAYAPLCGGTTTTGALQQATTGFGTSGTVLTSNGSSALPSWQSVSGGSVTIDGDSGSASGSTITFNANSQAGKTVKFVASGSTVSLDTSDGSGNTLIGNGTTITTGSNNTVIGQGAGAAQTTQTNNVFIGQGAAAAASGTNNVVIGQGAGALGVSINNVAIGYKAMSNPSSITHLQQNVAIGANALQNNIGVAVDFANNVAIGYDSLLNSTTGYQNVAIGGQSGLNLTTGAQNTLIGQEAGYNYTSSETGNIIIASYDSDPSVVGESNAIHIGTSVGGASTSAFIGGITGVVVTGSAVLVSSGDQLGVAASSARFKSNITDMASSSDAIHSLRPVTFTWNKSSSKGLNNAPDTTQYGLIAEEVHEVLPDIVNYDNDGAPFSVNYSDLIPMLLNEVQKLKKEVNSLKGS